MKTYSRIILGLLTLITLFWTVVATAQEKTTSPPAVNQQPIAARQARKLATPTPKAKPNLPARIPVESRLPDGFQDRVQKYPQMPSLMGMNVQIAESTVRRLQSNARISRQQGQYTNNYAPGVVISHTPERGALLRPGVEVVLYVNPQPLRLPQMPNLIGMKVIEAESRLSVLSPRTRSQRILSRQHNPNYRVDAVVDQSPGAGRELNSTVRVVLYVNPPPSNPKMPNLIGLDAASAERRLQVAAPNFQVRQGRGRQHNPNYGQNIVIAQNPGEGTDLTPGTPVIIYLNLPPPVPKMPNVVGMDSSAAEGQLQREAPNVLRRLETASRHDSNYRVGVIVSQVPDVGTELTRGTGIVLYVNPQPPQKPIEVKVPDVRGLALGQAKDVLGSLQLGIKLASNQSGDFNNYNVTGQRPQPGEMIPVGREVILTITPPLPPPSPTLPPGPPEERTTVPDLKHKELADVGSLLRAARLELGEVTKKDSKEIASFVLEQTPVAGTKVVAGTRINLVVGKKPDGGIWVEWPKVLATVAVGLAALGLAGLWKFLRPKPPPTPSVLPTPDPGPPPTVPAISFRTTMNANPAEFAASTDLHTSFALQFQPRADWGQQYVTVNGALIAAESEE